MIDRKEINSALERYFKDNYDNCSFLSNMILRNRTFEIDLWDKIVIFNNLNSYLSSFCKKLSLKETAYEIWDKYNSNSDVKMTLDLILAQIFEKENIKEKLYSALSTIKGFKP